jgi:hypothetical protein
MSKTAHLMKEMSKGCALYEPCPLCYKCMVKASHLYIKCENCEVPFCGHNHKQRSYMIRRENFAIKVSDETAAKFEELVCKCHKKEGQ